MACVISPVSETNVVDKLKRRGADTLPSGWVILTDMQ
jgi:hypothetical protein